jgi:hypothetical protein
MSGQQLSRIAVDYMHMSLMRTQADLTLRSQYLIAKITKDSNMCKLYLAPNVCTDLEREHAKYMKGI